jgi:tRNA pseudouridine55 synthase
LKDARDAGPGPSGVLLLDKPAGVTSTRALAVARRRLESRRAGHTGTLDPFATGLLPLAFGEATKFSRFLLDAPKEYQATLRLGYVSSTGDPEGEISRGRPFTGDRHAIEGVLGQFLGVIRQVPPMHSALHHGGKRLYELARAGEEVPREPREVTIYKLDLCDNFGENALISVKCSKGTYVRTLAEDIGRRLDCGAYLVALRRTAVGGFHVDDGVRLEQLDALDCEQAAALLRPPESLASELPRCEIGEPEARRFLQGCVVEAFGDPGEAGVFSKGGRFLGVGARDGAGGLRPVRLMRREALADVPDFA